MSPIYTRDTSEQIAKYEAYEPDAQNDVFYHIKSDGVWVCDDIPMTDWEAREVCRTLVAGGAKNVMALRALRQGVKSFSKGAEYVYPSSLAAHPHTWIALPQ